MKAITIVAAIVPMLGVALGWKSSASKDLQPATDAAYRDGHYLGKLAAEHGERPHISVARWSTPKDRASFGSGYQEAYSKVVDADNVESQRDVFNLAAYRDGLYIGGLDAQEAKTEHIAIGRWSGVQNRAAFSAGYLQRYSVMTDFENRSGHMLSAVQAMDK